MSQRGNDDDYKAVMCRYDGNLYTPQQLLSAICGTSYDESECQLNYTITIANRVVFSSPSYELRDNEFAKIVKTINDSGVEIIEID